MIVGNHESVKRAAENVNGSTQAVDEPFNPKRAVLTSKCAHVEVWNNPNADSVLRNLFVLFRERRQNVVWRDEFLCVRGSPDHLLPSEIVSAVIAKLSPSQKDPRVDERGLALYFKGGRTVKGTPPQLVLGPAREYSVPSYCSQTKIAKAAPSTSKNADASLTSFFRRFNIIRGLAHLQPFRRSMDQLATIKDDIEQLLELDFQENPDYTIMNSSKLLNFCPPCSGIQNDTFQLLIKSFDHHMNQLFQMQFAFSGPCNGSQEAASISRSQNINQIIMNSSEGSFEECIKQFFHKHAGICPAQQQQFRLEASSPLLAVVVNYSSEDQDFFQPQLSLSLSGVFDSCDVCEYRLGSVCSKKTGTNIWSAHCRGRTLDKWQTFTEKKYGCAFNWKTTQKLWSSRDSILLLFYHMDTFKPGGQASRKDRFSEKTTKDPKSAHSGLCRQKLSQTEYSDPMSSPSFTRATGSPPSRPTAAIHHRPPTSTRTTVSRPSRPSPGLTEAIHHRPPTSTPPTVSRPSEGQKSVDKDCSRPFDPKLGVGSWVQAKYSDKKWYPAEIEEERPDGKFLLKWCDGDPNERIKGRDEISPFRDAHGQITKFRVGQKIKAHCLLQGKFPGVIEKCFEGEKYLVRWDNNNPLGRVNSAEYIEGIPEERQSGEPQEHMPSVKNADFAEKRAYNRRPAEKAPLRKTRRVQSVSDEEKEDFHTATIDGQGDAVFTTFELLRFLL